MRTFLGWNSSFVLKVLFLNKKELLRLKVQCQQTYTKQPSDVYLNTTQLVRQVVTNI